MYVWMRWKSKMVYRALVHNCGLNWCSEGCHLRLQYEQYDNFELMQKRKEKASAFERLGVLQDRQRQLEETGTEKKMVAIAVKNQKMGGILDLW